MQKDNRICIVGMGFVGLTLAVVLAERGFQVLGLESDVQKLGLLNRYRVHFHEEGLAERCRAAVTSGSLKFDHPATQGRLDDYQVFFLTVGTPLDNQGQPRMDMVERSAKYVAELMPDSAMVVLRSTVKLGTTRSVVLPILESSGKAFDLCYCSERTLEGRALQELVELPQVVGSLNDESAARADQLFNRLTDKVIHVSNLETAELIKLLDNSFRDYSFAFGNEVALICEAAGLNASEVIKTANWEYPRTNIPRPGFVGGPCLEKDPHILCSSLQPYGLVPRLIKLARNTNEYLPLHVIDDIEAWVKENPPEKRLRISLIGLAFKGEPATDDLRGTPVKALIAEIRNKWNDCELFGFDSVCSRTQIRDELGITPLDCNNSWDIKDMNRSHVIIVCNDNKRNHEAFGQMTVETEGRPEKQLIFDCWGNIDPYYIDRWCNPGDWENRNTTYRKLGDNGR